MEARKDPRSERVARGIQFLLLRFVLPFHPLPLVRVVHEVNRQPNLDVSSTRGCPLAFHWAGPASIYIALRDQLLGILSPWKTPRPTGPLASSATALVLPCSRWYRSGVRSSKWGRSFRFSAIGLVGAHPGVKIKRRKKAEDNEDRFVPY